MTWLYIPSPESSCSQASACSAKDCEPGSPTWASRIAQSATLSGKLTQPASWSRAWRKAAWMRHLSGPTLPPSTQRLGMEKWIASLPDSPARTCLSPVVAPDSTESAAACSSRSPESQPIAVRASCFWRTSQASLLPPPPLWTKPKANSTSARPPESWENWPTSGGMRNGSLFPRPTWAPVMAARAGSALSGAWLTPHGMSGMEAETGKAGAGGEFAKQATQWMTPNVPNGGRHVPPELIASKGMTEDGQKRTVGLESQTKYWSSPRATDGTKGGPNQAGSKGDLMLPSQVCQWPTPVANDDNKTPEAHMAMKSRMKGGPRNTITSLQVLVQQWPTPAARDGKGANSEEHATVTGGGAETHGSTSQLCGLFAPGPADPRWTGILAEYPELAPALEPAFRGVVNGLAFDMGDSRAARLKCVGNGVVALCAATAVVVLVRRAGLA